MHLGKAPWQRCFGIRFTAHKRIHIKEKTSDHWAHVKPVANVTNLSDMKNIYIVKKKPYSHAWVMRTYFLNFYEDQYERIHVTETRVALFRSNWWMFEI